MPNDDQARLTLPPFAPLPQKAPEISVEHRSDGVVLIRSNHPPATGPRSIAHLLVERAAEFPDHARLLYGGRAGSADQLTRRAARGRAAFGELRRAAIR